MTAAYMWAIYQQNWMRPIHTFVSLRQSLLFIHQFFLTTGLFIWNVDAVSIVGTLVIVTP